jgi:polysaccharide export outer membrane protein
MTRKGTCIFIAAAGLLLTGCFISKRGDRFDARPSKDAVILTNLAQVETTNQISKDWLLPPTNYFSLGPGDKLEIEIIGDPNSRALTTVGPDGKLYYYSTSQNVPILPGIDVWGLTIAEAKGKLESILKEFFTEPQVSLQLRAIDSTRVWIMGRVANAGIYPMPQPMTLLEAVSVAGGTMSSSASGTTEELTDLSHSFIVRNGERLPVSLNRLRATFMSLARCARPRRSRASMTPSSARSPKRAAR